MRHKGGKSEYIITDRVVIPGIGAAYHQIGGEDGTGELLHRHLFEQGELRGIAGAFRGGVIPFDQGHCDFRPHHRLDVGLHRFQGIPRQQAAFPLKVARSGRMLDWALPEAIVSAMVVRVMAAVVGA